MSKIKLLDCTLRDGGYVNDWNFGHDNIVSIFERLVEANVDIIEIGFLDERRTFDIDRSIMPDTASVEKVYGGLNRKQAMIVGMIDYGTCSIANIQPCKDSFLDGIRVIFKKHLREEALAFCKQLKDLGYKVFAQLVSVTSYSDDEMMDLIRLANDVKPYAVSMVDTYGLMHQDNLMHYFDLLDKHLSSEIGMGYHAHNNFQMGYANCIAMLAMKTERLILVDGTIYGMGKSAGNAPIELVAMHMNHKYGKKYQISQMLEAIDANISQFYTPATWGYNMFYYLAASNDCHPNYVAYLMEKKKLSVKSINELLGKLEGEKKLLYDKEYIEELYVAYQKNECDDTEDLKRLKEEFANKNILLLGPGNHVIEQQERVFKYIAEKKPIVIAINFMPQIYKVNYILMSNSKRYVQLATALSKLPDNIKTIATSNVTKTQGKFDISLNYSSLLDEKAMIVDNPLIMILKVINRFDTQEVALAGFDGYTTSERPDYVIPKMEHSFSKTQASEINEDTKESIKRLKLKYSLNYITDSIYDEG